MAQGARAMKLSGAEPHSDPAYVNVSNYWSSGTMGCEVYPQAQDSQQLLFQQLMLQQAQEQWSCGYDYANMHCSMQGDYSMSAFARTDGVAPFAPLWQEMLLDTPVQELGSFDSQLSEVLGHLLTKRSAQQEQPTSKLLASKKPKEGAASRKAAEDLKAPRLASTVLQRLGGCKPPPGLEHVASTVGSGSSTADTDDDERAMADVSFASRSSNDDDTDDDERAAATAPCPVQASPREDEQRTTLMVRNVPSWYTQEMLLMEWPIEGTGYDFLYMPHSTSTKQTSNYVFINFLTEELARAFMQKWHKQRLSLVPTPKQLNISFAEVQGREKNLVQLRKKRVQRIRVKQYQPIIVKDGRCISIEEALKGCVN